MVQKNMVAIENRKRMIAYGDAAFEMYEKSPASICVSRPITNGVIADIQNMELLIRAFIEEQYKSGFKSADYIMSIPTDVTEVEKRAFSDLIKDARMKARNVLAVEKSIADALGMGIDVKNSQGVLIVDVGYDTTEISVLSLGGIVLSRMVKTGGHAFDTSIVNAVRREFNLVIGMKTAENVRIAFNNTEKHGSVFKVYGRDIVTGLPVERTLTSRFVEETLGEHFRAIAENIKQILERTPPELAADIYRHGLFLTGGASGEEGLADAIHADVRLIVNISENPISTAALGLAQVIKKTNFRSLAYTIEGLGK